MMQYQGFNEIFICDPIFENCRSPVKFTFHHNYAGDGFIDIPLNRG